MFERTVRDFVRFMCVRGCSDPEIMAVARCTRWETSLGEVKVLLDRRGEVWRQKAIVFRKQGQEGDSDVSYCEGVSV